jgi:DNA (cytosine-5)-methyltransferase 1
VEREAYAVARLAALALQGYLDEAPIWDDLWTFDGLPWRGRVDIVAAGFPCQPFSQAGPRTGIADPRWLWPRIIQIVRDIRPAYVFLENSPQVRQQGLPIILGDLSRTGFDAEWDVFSAIEEGFPHLRRRFFLLAAHADRVRQQQPDGRLGEVGGWPRDRGEETPADAIGLRGLRAAARGAGEEADGWPGDGSAPDASDPPGAGREAIRWGGMSAKGRDTTAGGNGGADAADADELDGHGRGHAAGTFCRQRPGQAFLSGSDWECAFWCAQSGVCVVDDGSAYRLDELRALGNAVIPAVVARAWRELSGRLAE